MTKKSTPDQEVQKSKRYRVSARAALLIFFVSIIIATIFLTPIADKFKIFSKKEVLITKFEPQQYKKIAVQKTENFNNKKLLELERKYDLLKKKYEEIYSEMSKIQNGGNSPHIILSYFKLIKKIEDGGDYRKELLLTKSLINSKSKLYQSFLKLEKLLINKIKTNQEIKQDFDQIIRKIIYHEKGVHDDTMLSKLKNNFLNYVTIRKIKFREDDVIDIDYTLHKIENNLKFKDYQKALYLLNRLDKNPTKTTSGIKKNLEILIQFQKIDQEIIYLFE
ncbi:MAG: hypothetical protein ACI9IL_000707 [Rickettsiales bacterium]|jgi:hypothetical protein